MANLNRQALDAQRKINGQPPFTDDEFKALELASMSDEEKAALAEAEKNNPKNPETKPIVEPEVKVREMSDEELMELVAQKTGRKVTGWDELKPTAEIIDKEKADEERETAKITWGLQNKKFKPKEYEGYVADRKDPVNLVYNYRLQEAKKEDPALDEKEFKEEFDEEFGLDQKPDTRRYKNGQSTIKRLASSIIESTYGSIVSLDKDYTGYEKQVQSQNERKEKIKAEAPAYKTTVDKVFSNLKKIKTQFSKDEEYEVEAPEEIETIMNGIKETMLSPEYASSQILKGYTEAELNELAFTALLRQAFPILSKEISKQYLKKHAAGTKGILTLNPSGNTSDDSNLTEAQQKMKTIIEQNKVVPAAAN